MLKLNFIYKGTPNSIATQSEHSQGVDLETFPNQPVLEWSATYDSSDDDEYDPTEENSSDEHEFDSDIEDFDEEEDASFMFNELECLRKDGLDREVEEEEEKEDEKEEGEQVIEDEEVLDAGESESYSEVTRMTRQQMMTLFYIDFPLLLSFI